MTSKNSVIVYAQKKIQNRKKRARLAKAFSENEVYNQSNNWVMIPPELLMNILKFSYPVEYQMRIICRRWAASISKYCLSKKYARELVQEMEYLFTTNSPLSSEMKSKCEIYHCMNYWPPSIASLDVSQWNQFFDAATELKNFNWKSLLDDHFYRQNLPLIFHRDNVYAFCVVAQLKSLFVTDRNIQQVEHLLTVICGRKPNFHLWINQIDNSFHIKFKIALEKQKFTVKGKGDTIHECIRSFYGELLLLFAKHHMMYFEIAKFIYQKFPFDWRKRLDTLTEAVPDEQKGLFKIETIDLPVKNGFKYVKMVVGSYKRTGKAYSRALAMQYASKKLVLFVEKHIVEQ